MIGKLSAAALLLLAATSGIRAETAGNVVLGKYKWKNLRGKVINVCWEKPGYDAEKLLVKQTVEMQWEDFIDINFEFHGVCDLDDIFHFTSLGVQWVGIKVQDTSPHTKGLGNLLNMNYDGTRPADPFLVRLNFQMTNWPTDAFDYNSKTPQQKSMMKDALIRLQAAHEFGHVLGLGHEHARRRDVPGGCRDWTNENGISGTQIVEEQSLTLDHIYYDAYSIMNYCNILDASYPQHTVSCGDVASARHLYGSNSKGYAPCCTPERVQEMVTGSDYQGTGINQWIAAARCNDRTIGTSPGPGAPGPSGPAVSHRTHPAIDIEPVDKNPSTSPDPDFQWEIKPQTRKIRGIDVTGYEIAFTAMNLAYASTEYYPANSLNSLCPKSMLLPGETMPRDVLVSGQNQDIQRDGTLSTNDFWFKNGTVDNWLCSGKPGTPLANVQTKGWIAKGFGEYDQASGNWFHPISQPSANGTWKYAPDGTYRGHAHFDKGVFRMWAAYQYSIIKNYSYVKMALINLPFEAPPLRPYPILKTGFRPYGQMVHLWRKSFVPNLWWDKSEVSQLSYQEVMGLSPFGFPNGPNHPAEKVTWYDAVLYCIRRSQLEGLQSVYEVDNPVFNAAGQCTGFSNFRFDFNKTGYRLPTHEEWMLAYSSVPGSGYHWNSNPENHAWYGANAGGTTRPGSQKNPNSRGLYDMAGNVREWVHASAASASANAVGGDYESGVDKLVYSHYYQYGKSNAYPWIGFRTVRKGRSPYLPAIMNLLLQ